MAEHSSATTGHCAQSLALWSVVLGLIVGAATFLVATQSPAAPDRDVGTLESRRVGVLLLAFTGPFLLALASMRLRAPATQRMVRLISGLLALGVGVFLIAAGVGLIAAWWNSR